MIINFIIIQLSNYLNSKTQNIIENIRNYTILIKNDIEFRKFKKKE